MARMLLVRLVEGQPLGPVLEVQVLFLKDGCPLKRCAVQALAVLAMAILASQRLVSTQPVLDSSAVALCCVLLDECVVLVVCPVRRLVSPLVAWLLSLRVFVGLRSCCVVVLFLVFFTAAVRDFRCLVRVLLCVFLSLGRSCGSSLSLGGWRRHDGRLVYGKVRFNSEEAEVLVRGICSQAGQ